MSHGVMPLGAAPNLPVFEKRQSWTRPSAPTSTVNVALPGSPIGKPGSGATDTPSPPSRSSPGSDQRNFAASTPLVGLPSLSSAGENLPRSEEHTSELPSLMRISYAVFCLQKKTPHKPHRAAAPRSKPTQNTPETHIQTP